MEKNLTNGSVFKNIIYFSLPFLLSYFLQTLYGLADLFIIGRFCPTASTTAVSIGSQVMHMLTVMIVGLVTGSLVLIGKAVGAGDSELKNKAVGNTVTVFFAISLVLTALLLLCTKPIVKVMSTPGDAVEGTVNYLRICFAGIPFIVLYNVISSVFRGMGDSKSPMYFIAVACVCNIGLDFLLIGKLGMDSAGAALGTTLSQTISVIIAVFFIVKKNMISGISKAHFRLRKNIVGQIMRVGIPISLQDGFIQIAFLLITVFANNRGLTDSAAVGISEKVIGILFLVPSTLMASVSALCAQNVGAGKHDRAKKTMLDAIAIAVVSGLFFSVLFQFISPFVISLFTKDASVIETGTPYLKSYVWDCLFAAIHFIFSGYFCAYSRSEFSFIHNSVSALFARIPLSYYFSKAYKSLFYMGTAAPIGSILSILICIVFYIGMNRKSKSSQNIRKEDIVD
ncbi:MAG: MATE family efflux transporter [Clostridia bacterium]|nr:MATE family efflux transporter [Clostridia bacterium]